MDLELFGVSHDPLLGRILGGCLLQERIGRGGMGIVYRATRQADGHPVAIKILSPLLASDPAVLARFAQEARAASRIRHPNVVRILGSSQQEGLHFILMDLIRGTNLSALLKGTGPLPVGQATAIAREITQGLAALHAEGIIHRDVKPSNVLLGEDGSVKISDFGVARDLSEVRRLTATGDLLGTIGFAAPEQVEGSPASAAADLYSLGATLFHMLSGIRPSALPEKLLESLDPKVPLPMRSLLQRLLAHDPADRPRAAEVVDHLEPFANRVQEIHESLRSQGIRPFLTVAAGCMAAAAGGLASFGRGSDREVGSWTFVFPDTESIPGTAGASIVSILLLILAFTGRGTTRFGLRSLIGFGLLAGSLVLAYQAGCLAGMAGLKNVPWMKKFDLTGWRLSSALNLAGLGLFLGMCRELRTARRLISGLLIFISLALASLVPSFGAEVQALKNLRLALERGPWIWLSLPLAGTGLFLGLEHQGRLIRLLLAPVSIFTSILLAYEASRGAGSPPLREALLRPGVAAAVAIFLALGAKGVLDLGPRHQISDASRGTTRISSQGIGA